MGVRFAEGFRLVRVRFNGFYPHSKNPKKKMRNTNIGQYIGRYIAPWPIYRPILVQNEMIKKMT